MLRPKVALESAREISGAKELIRNDVKIDTAAAFARRHQFAQKWNDKFLIDLDSGQGVDIIRRTARLRGERIVEVSSTNGEATSITASQAVLLATGSERNTPDIPGLAEVNFWTIRNATSANEVPEHLIILGGGVVGCEMATAYSTFGGTVTLISSGRQSKICGQDFDWSKGIGLEGLDIQDVQQFSVDESLCVKLPSGRWLYAIGDVNGRNPLTHIGLYQTRAASMSMIATARSKEPAITPCSSFAATADHSAATQVVVTDPNVASVGLTLAEPKKKGLNLKEVVVPFQFPGAWVHAEFDYDGWAQWVIDADKGVLVGATVIDRGAGDLLRASNLVVVGEVPVERFWHAVATLPTISEIYSRLLLASGY